MKTFPLVRVKVSNEYIMALLFLNLLLFQVPYWMENIVYMLGFMGVLLIGLLIDIIVTMRIEGEVKCCVSTGVTISIIYALFPEIPFLGGLLGVIISVVFGKLIWGGMGKNIFNPAMIGVLFLSIFFQTGGEPFGSHILIIIAMILSIPFIPMRPYASLGLMGGMIIPMILSGTFGLNEIISTGVLFFGCIVITDPVTVTRNPLIGGVGGLCAGFIGMLTTGYPRAGTMALLILGVNAISYIFEKYTSSSSRVKSKGIRIKAPYDHVHTGRANRTVDAEKFENMTFTDDYILKRIKDNGVVGLGGAGFSTYIKLKETVQAKEKEKILIVNGVECDPGLLHDKWIIREYSKEIEIACNIIRSCLHGCRIILTTKNTGDLNYGEGIEVVKVPDNYPIGEERRLIKNLLGVNISRDVIPCKKEILVLNVQTILSVYKAVCLDEKAISKYITVADLINKRGFIKKVNLGDKIENVVEDLYDGNGAILVGGGLMNGQRADGDDEIQDSTNLIAVGKMPRYKNGRCSKCGICVKGCPAGIEVYKISKLVEEGNIQETIKYNPKDCISCGICSYYCLSGKNLAVNIKRAKEYALKK